MAAIRYDCRPQPHLLSAGALPPRYHVDRIRHSPPRRLHHHGVVWMPTGPAATDTSTARWFEGVVSAPARAVATRERVARRRRMVARAQKQNRGWLHERRRRRQWRAPAGLPPTGQRDEHATRGSDAVSRPGPAAGMARGRGGGEPERRLPAGGGVRACPPWYLPVACRAKRGGVGCLYSERLQTARHEARTHRRVRHQALPLPPSPPCAMIVNAAAADCAGRSSPSRATRGGGRHVVRTLTLPPPPTA